MDKIEQALEQPVATAGEKQVWVKPQVNSFRAGDAEAADINSPDGPTTS